MVKVFASVGLLMISIFSFSQSRDSLNNELVNSIQNPIVALYSLPLQNNIHFGKDSTEIWVRNTLNIQPVIPITIKNKVNLIIRTILPVVSQPLRPLGKGEGSKFGLGDLTLTVFASPVSKCIFTWGLGSVITLPTATSPILGSEKFSIGPAFVWLIQKNGWTVGSLQQNTWSVAGNGYRETVNFFYAQLFVTKNLPKGWYINTAPIITCNWKSPKGDQLTLPVGAGFGKLFTNPVLPVNVQIGGYWFALKPENGPDWELRIQMALLFPK